MNKFGGIFGALQIFVSPFVAIAPILNLLKRRGIKWEHWPEMG